MRRAVPPALAACLAALGCAAPAPEPDPGDPARGRALFAANCAGCHGADARGGGPLAAGLPAAPPNLRRLAARAGGRFDRDLVMSTVFAPPAGEAGPMPAFGHGDLGEAIVVEEEDGIGTPVHADLLAIANYLESVQE